MSRTLMESAVLIIRTRPANPYSTNSSQFLTIIPHGVLTPFARPIFPVHSGFDHITPNFPIDGVKFRVSDARVPMIILSKMKHLLKWSKEEI
jgi:hypothetical protein